MPSKSCLDKSLFLLAVALTFVMGTSVLADEVTAAEQTRLFETHVRPLLHSKCVKCHGENQQKGGLRLDSIEGLLAGGESGTAIEPGKPDSSLLMEAVRYESFEMPPDNPLSAEEIAHLQTWISAGAAWPKLNGKSVRLTGVEFTDEERGFWSLQPVTHPTVPPTKAKWALNPIDQFVAAKLRDAKIDPAPKASTEVLIRRLYFDLLGVPPSPEDVAAFHADSGDQATRFSNLTERLLADSRYGEHWGRYWLDVVRYAESDGFRADGYRPNAWRYRDYVVNAFNTDKPYDQFVSEQLAGDELAPDKAEALVATGYLRTYLYEYNQRDARTQWQDILNQVTDVTGEAFLGIGVGCARCHDHKFDPILQEDYYRLRAAFGTMLPRDDIPAADLVERQRYDQQFREWQNKAADLRQQLSVLKQPYLKKAAVSAITKFPEDIQEIMAKADDVRNPLEQQLADLVNRQVWFEEERVKYKDEDKKQIDALELQLKSLAGNPPSRLPKAITVADVSNQPFALHVGGSKSRKAVTAGGLSILDRSPFDLHPTNSSTGQRTALARWITDPANPLAARVIVNRIWQQHFGTGLVNTASDFGTLGGRPSHPELLDWLASEFVANGWSIKWLHRLILNSGTWQMSAFHPQATVAEQTDPANRLRWRFDIKRLAAEQIRDAMLTTSGELQSESGGPSVEHNSLRRSLYLKILRNKPEPLMNSLDGVDGLNSVSKRSTTTTPTQALNLMNGEWVRKRSVAMAGRLLDEVEPSNTEQLVEAAFQLALGRSAQESELAAAKTLLQQSRSSHQANHASSLQAPLASRSGKSVRIGGDGFQPPQTTAPYPSATAPFTVVGIFRLDSLFSSANVRTLISQWNGSKTTGWSIGITSEKSAYKPRNLILQPVGVSGYEVVASNLRPELGQAYFVAVTVLQTAKGKGRASFFLKPVDAKAGGTQTAVVEFRSAKGFANELPVVIGGRTKSSGHNWDGNIDQIGLFDRSLKDDEIQKLFNQQLATVNVLKQSPVAFWDFDNASAAGVSAVSAQYPLQLNRPNKLNAAEASLAELCHVLLNSNEFVYVD